MTLALFVFWAIVIVAFGFILGMIFTSAVYAERLTEADRLLNMPAGEGEQ